MISLFGQTFPLTRVYVFASGHLSDPSPPPPPDGGVGRWDTVTYPHTTHAREEEEERVPNVPSIRE